LIPGWLSQQKSLEVPRSADGKRGSIRFLSRTLEEVARVSKELLLIEKEARKPGWLQSLDPRIKIITLTGLLVLISFLHSPSSLALILILSLVLALGSRISLGHFFLFAFLFPMLFAGLIVLPSAFNFITPGEPLWVLFSLSRSYSLGPYHLPETIAVTRQGLQGAGLVILRVSASVGLAFLLTWTTPLQDLLRALRILWVPQVFVLILGMALRYLGLLAQLVQEMVMARKSRTIRPGPAGEARRWVTGRMGALFTRSYQMSQEVHQAMLARGFSGEAKGISLFKVRGRDYIWLTFTIVSGALIYLWDRWPASL
jgi:cobalt/nickel transport system permease protein